MVVFLFELCAAAGLYGNFGQVQCCVRPRRCVLSCELRASPPGQLLVGEAGAGWIRQHSGALCGPAQSPTRHGSQAREGAKKNIFVNTIAPLAGDNPAPAPDLTHRPP